MYTTHRPSILHRPRKETSQATKETFDSQHEREQQIWAAKSERYQDTQDRLLRSLYPTPEDKLLAADEVRQSLDQHYKAKEYQRQLEQQQDEVWTRPTSASPHGPQQHDGGAPWRTSTLNYGSKEEEDFARRQWAAQVADDNRMLIQLKAVHKVQQEDAERQMARMTVTDESSFWNLGSTNDRWLMPERRRSPREGYDAPPPAHLRAPYVHESPDGGRGPAMHLQQQQYVGEAAQDAQGNVLSRPATAASATFSAAGGGTGQLPAYAWGEDSTAQQQVAPWGAADERGIPVQQQGLRYGSRPASKPCPFATSHQDCHQQPAQETQRPPTATQHLASGRYGSRPETSAAPFAIEPQLGQPPLEAPQLVQQQQRRYASRPDAKDLPFATDAYYSQPAQRYGNRPDTSPGQLAAEPQYAQQAHPALATQGSVRYGSRPEANPRPFATDLDYPAQQKGQAQAAWAAQPSQSLRYASRPDAKERPFATDGGDYCQPMQRYGNNPRQTGSDFDYPLQQTQAAGQMSQRPSGLPDASRRPFATDLDYPVQHGQLPAQYTRQQHASFCD